MQGIGHVYCYKCNREISSQTVQQIVDQVKLIPEKTKIMILAPVANRRKGEFKKDLNDLRKKGFVRARINGEVRSLEDEIILDKKFKHTIEVVIDRLIIKTNMEKRLTDSVEIGLLQGAGTLVIAVLKENEKDEELLFSEKFACSYCNISYPELEPRLFSFNSPHGACVSCEGLGTKMIIDSELIVPDNSLSIRDGAIKPWEKRTSINFYQMLESIAKHFKFKLNTPFKNLSKEITEYSSLRGGE